MTPERKIEKIVGLFTGLEVAHMTSLELRVYEVIKGKKPTAKQTKQAERNTDAILD